MQEITLSCVQWSAPDDFYNALLLSLGAPEWHGHNFNALWDSITGGGINRVNPPFLVSITGVHQMPANCKSLVDSFVALVSEAKSAGYPVEIVCL